MPQVLSILETCLYCDDLPRSRDFYTQVFGFPVILDDPRLCVLKVSEQNVLILFRRGASLMPVNLSGGGAILPHDGSGPAHFAFSIPAGSLEEWRAHLREHGVVIESEVSWSEGSTSLYFRDPDGHLGELATAGLWGLRP